jgi:hypothetical protein
LIEAKAGSESGLHGQGLLLIAATSYGQPEDRVRTEAAGFDFHMVKPLDPQTVAAEIAKWAKSGIGRRPVSGFGQRRVPDSWGVLCGKLFFLPMSQIWIPAFEGLA